MSQFPLVGGAVNRSNGLEHVEQLGADSRVSLDRCLGALLKVLPLALDAGGGRLAVVATGKPPL